MGTCLKFYKFREELETNDTAVQSFEGPVELIDRARRAFGFSKS